MNSKEIPTHLLDLKGAPLPFSRIHKEFSETSYGKTLDERIRWKWYKPASVSNRDWVKILGNDANNLEHMALIYGMCRQFLRHHKNADNHKNGEKELAPLAVEISTSCVAVEQFSPDEQKILLLTAIVHDWAEAVIGDILTGKKTDKDKENEGKIFKDILQETLGTKLPQEILDAVINTNMNKQSKLGSALKAVEIMSFCRTAINAWEKSRNGHTAIADNLHWLVYNVFAHTTLKILKLSEKYPVVASYLKKNQDTITNIFKNMPEKTFEHYDPSDREKNRKAFADSKTAWEKLNMANTQQVGL